MALKMGGEQFVLLWEVDVECRTGSGTTEATLCTGTITTGYNYYNI